MTLEEQINLLIAENKNLKAIISNLEKHITEQDARIAELEEQLRKLMITKDSSNSSKPPSSDISSPKRNQSLREPSGKQTGGQPGHQGATLQMSNSPDEIIELQADYCNECGCSLENVEAHFETRRQVVDIPPISPIITEYRNYGKHCPKCGNYQKSSFPEGINNNIQYGHNVEAAISYFSVYQYIPFKRLKECLKHFFNLDVSQGSIDNVLRRMSLKSGIIYDRIKETLLSSHQIGSDETSAKVNGEKWWIWVWQTVKSTFLTASQSRGSQTIDSLYPDGFEKAVLNSDRWAAQLKTKSLGHQLCISHLLRDLKYLEQLEKNDWTSRLKEVLKKALKLKEQYPDYNRSDTAPLQLEQELDLLLKENIPKVANSKTLAFQKSLIKQRGSIFTFLYNKETPSDNNASERAIRNVKVKQKISGQFKSGESIFCTLRSVIDTCLKRNVDVMYALNSISQFSLAE